MFGLDFPLRKATFASNHSAENRQQKLIVKSNPTAGLDQHEIKTIMYAVLWVVAATDGSDLRVGRYNL